MFSKHPGCLLSVSGRSAIAPTFAWDRLPGRPKCAGKPLRSWESDAELQAFARPSVAIGVRQQRKIAGPLDGLRQLSLVLG
jgi:hypothetical protein